MRTRKMIRDDYYEGNHLAFCFQSYTKFSITDQKIHICELYSTVSDMHFVQNDLFSKFFSFNKV